MPPVLLIDEVDRSDDEFEAFLLEILSDFAVTIPELGTIRADRPPVAVLTSNRTREVHDALKRRCLYFYIEHPSFEREVEIVRLRVPEAEEQAGPPGAQRRRERSGPWTSTSRQASPRPSTGPRRSWPSGPKSWTRIDRPGHSRLGPEVPRGPAEGGQRWARGLSVVAERRRA